MAYPTAATRDIAAPAEKVWALVSDLPRMGEWSPENAGGKWVKGATGPGARRRLQGHQQERRPALVHHRHGRRLRAEQGVRVRRDVGTAGGGQLALRVRGDRRRAAGSPSRGSDHRKPWFATVARVMGDHSAAHAEQEMAATLANLAAAVE